MQAHANNAFLRPGPFAKEAALFAAFLARIYHHAPPGNAFPLARSSDVLATADEHL